MAHGQKTKALVYEHTKIQTHSSKANQSKPFSSLNLIS